MNTAIACGGILLQEWKVLLTKRHSTKKNFPNCWTFPAWTLETSDENLVSCALREVKEEVWLDFQHHKVFWVYDLFVWETRMLGILYTWEWSGTIVLQTSEASEYQWMNYEQTLNEEIAFGYKRTLSDLHSQWLLL